jgi:calcium permeable stress-gated cation channel
MGLDVSSLSVIATLRIQGAIGIILLLLFEYYRRQPEIYAPKMRSRPKRCPKEPPAGFFAWFSPLMSLSDEETLRCTGLDGFIFLRFLKLCAKMALGCGIFSLIVLLPIYKTSPGHQKGVVGIMLYTMANIAPGGDRLWAPFLCTYFFTFFFLYLLVTEYKNFVRLRQDFMRDGDPDLSSQQLYSVVVENIPRAYQSSKKLQELFEELFPENVYSAKIAMKYGPIVKAEDHRMEILSKLENSVAAYEASDRDKMPMVKLRNGKPAMIGCCGNEAVEAISFYEKELVKSNGLVSGLKKQAKSVDKEAAGVKYEEPVEGEVAEADIEKEAEVTATHFTAKSLSGTGFVTFTSLRAQASAYQVAVLSDKYPRLKAFPADAPQNIIWNNVFVRYDQVRYSLSIAHAAYYVGLIFWATIVSTVAAFSQLSNLEKFLPFLKQLDDESKALLEGQLPVIALIVLMALLPMIFKAVGTFVVKQKTSSEVNHEVTEFFYLYQLANVYLMLFAGSLLGAIGDILKNPLTVVNLLAAALPGVATFFINLLLTMTLGGVPMVLLRIAPLVIFKLQVAISNPRKLTKRALLDGPLAPVELPYSVEVPRMMYVLCIALLYMVSNALFAPCLKSVYACCHVCIMPTREIATI